MIAIALIDIKPPVISRIPPRPRPGSSRPVSSTQSVIHPRLSEVLHRHLTRPDLTPVAAHNRRAFERVARWLDERDGPLLLDSFCGTGLSTTQLAQRHPDHLVLGVDKSAHRIARHRGRDGDNCLIVQAECEPLWTLLAAAGIRADYHYLLYPNPWPKPGHLQRRIHGHPAFAAMLRLGGRVELRSNWQLYVEEFGVAMHLAGHPGLVSRLPPEAGEEADLSLFERKYRRSGHELWVCRVDLDRSRR